MPQWVLASRSPQRKELLDALGVTFAVVPSTVDEAPCAEPDFALRALRLAKEKAADVHGQVRDAVVIGCDTLVVAPDGTLLEKPVDAADAERMLRLQSGGVSTVHSGLVVIAPDGTAAQGVSSSAVRFRSLSDADIAWWITGGLWQDRSGAFQIDGPGQLLIERMEGDFTGVVGLPVFLLGQLCAQIGFPLQGTTMR